MNLNILLAFIGGAAFGLSIAFLLKWFHRRSAQNLAETMLAQSAEKNEQNIQQVVAAMKESFGNLSLDALNRSSEQFLKLANQSFTTQREVNVKELDNKKSLIDNELKRLSSELENVTTLMQTLDKDRAEKFGVLSTELKKTNSQTSDLMNITNQLHQVLSSTKMRGQWGERMADDVLTLAGFIENVNYLKNRSSDGGKSRPDFTFLLPRELKLNMDVKFPLDNYIRFVEAEGPADKNRFRSDFLKDVKARMKEVTSRNYIDPANNTLDYVLLFIPNEQIYAFIHDQDQTLLEKALQNKVVFCSPITLFAVLAVIRQSVDNFSLEKTSNEILRLLGQFKKQWDQFVGKLETVGKRIADAQKEYDTLTSTRKRQLEKPLNQIEELRNQRSISLDSDGSTEPKKLPIDTTL